MSVTSLYTPAAAASTPLFVSEDASIKKLSTSQTKTNSNVRNWIPLPNELKEDLDRGLLPRELDLASKDMQLESAQTPVSNDRETQPTAVILIGAGGAGKTSLLKRLPSYIPGFTTTDYFLNDGDYLRRYHRGFQRSCQDTRIGYIGGWCTVKPHIRDAKALLLEQAVNDRQNVLIPTGQHAPQYVKMMTEAGYKVHIIGVYADCETIMKRGVIRGHETGREYLGTVEMWEKASRDMLQLVRDVDPTLKTSGVAMLLDNRDFKKPQVVSVEQMHKILFSSGCSGVEE
jgi:hypothetical protein